MKKMLRLALLNTLIGHSCFSFAGPSPKGEYLRKGYYIVVAAYRIGHEQYMEKYEDRLNKSGLHTKHGYDLGRRYYYIYLDYYNDFDESIHQMLKTRKDGGFTDAWVRVMPDMAPDNSISTATPAVEKIAEEKVTASVQVASPTLPIVKEPEVIATPTVEQPPAVLPETVGTTMKVETSKEEPVRGLKTLANTPVYLSLVHSRNNRPVESEIEIIDTERTRFITKVKGNSYVMLPDPKSKTGQLTLLCNAFGYRKVQHEVNFRSTEMDALHHYMVLMDSFYMVKFDLIRYHTGDISTLYSVYFYNDAAIMLPESTVELNRMLDMMNENPNYKIKLHGHTNGKAHGKMITMGPSKNYFALTDDVKNGIGSAKDLSRERAQVIKDWLVSKGVSADRMEIKAWGGGRMIHEKESVNAKKNVRVEVEVIAE